MASKVKEGISLVEKRLSVPVEGSLQIREMDDLKAKYGSCCKVISNIGDITNVVDLHKDNCVLNLKFQLEESYPDTPPCIIVKNKGLDVSDKLELMNQLNSMALDFVGSPMLEQLIEFAYSWCEGKECTEITEKRQEHTRFKGKNKKQKQKTKDTEEKSVTKLPPMKTAEDVISRIMWDENIPTENFCVGYEDRFVGIVERQFTDFSWEDIASVDYDTLAIPKHRIQYFKYKGLTVWDKSKRLDNVFGSTGSGMKITDVIDKYEKEQPPVNQMVLRSNDSDSDEDDEDLVITVDDGQNEGDIQYSKDKYWGPKKRPTHFLCLRVTDQTIVQAIEEVHRKIIELEPTYEESLIPARKLHMTLACLGLDEEYDVEQASDFLKDIHPHLESFKPKETIDVKFHGVDHFFHNVLYAKVDENKEMLNFVHELRKCLDEAGIEIRDVFDFNPHMTILKFKRHHQAMAHTRYIDSRFYEMFANTSFGNQSFDNIHLCKMVADEEDDDGFYICPRVLHF